MPYLEPAVVIEEFATYTREEIRPAIEDDEQFIHAQAGSMSSTLRFLSNELSDMESAVADQDTVLREAIDDVDEMVATSERQWEALAGAVTEAQTAVDDPPSTLRDHETLLLEVCNDLLEAIDDVGDEESARELRRPLYRFIDARLNAQLSMLGRETDE